MRLGGNQKIDLIRRVPLFARCSKPELKEIAMLADEIDLRAGKELTRQGALARVALPPEEATGRSAVETVEL